jgi:hypothetical protein
VSNARKIDGRFIFADGDQVAIDGALEATYESLSGERATHESHGLLGSGRRRVVDQPDTAYGSASTRTSSRRSRLLCGWVLSKCRTPRYWCGAWALLSRIRHPESCIRARGQGMGTLDMDSWPHDAALLVHLSG